MAALRDSRIAIRRGGAAIRCSALFAIPLLLSSRFSHDATDGPVIIRSRKGENSRHTISPDISSKVVKCDGIGCLRHATARVPASTLSAGTNRHDPVVRVARTAVRWPVWQVLLDNPIRDAFVPVPQHLSKSGSIHEQI